MYCSLRSVEVNVTCSGAVDNYQMNDQPLYINLTFTPPGTNWFFTTGNGQKYFSVLVLLKHYNNTMLSVLGILAINMAIVCTLTYSA
jgi:hypothetical protein